MKNYSILRTLVAVVAITSVLWGVLLMYQEGVVESLGFTKAKVEVKSKNLLKGPTVTIREPIQAVDDEESFSPMPDALQWWELDNVTTSVAVVLSRGKNMRKLHTFLGERIASMKGCPDPLGEDICLKMVGIMMERVDIFLRRMMRDAKVKSDWWRHGDSRMCNVAVIMASGGLRKLYAFSGKQAAKLEKFVQDSESEHYRMEIATETDAFFKTMVKDYGGPFIDRDFNRKSKL